MTPAKLRTCTCCGETKPSRYFSRDMETQTYTAFCRECGSWLRLLNKGAEIGKNIEAKSKAQRKYKAKKAIEKKVRIVALPSEYKTVWRHV